MFGPAPETNADANKLLKLGVTHVLDLRAETPAVYGGRFWKHTPVQYKLIGLDDFNAPLPEQQVRDAVDYAAGALLRPSAKVYVHCAAGLKRSPAIVYGILLMCGMDPSQAWALVKKARGAVFATYVGSVDRALGIEK